MLQLTLPPLPHYIIGGEDTYPVGAVHPSRSNIGVFDFIFVTKGCLYITENGKSFEISTGKYIILSPDGNHHATMPCTEETHFYWVHFHTCGNYRNIEETDLYERSSESEPYSQINQFYMYLPISDAYPVIEEIVQILKELVKLKEAIAFTTRLKEQQLFISFMEKISGKADVTKINRFYIVAEKAAEYLRQNSLEVLRYDLMSKALHFHENYIAQCMKMAFGCTPLEYLTHFRLERSKHLIIHSDLPIGTISEEVGFNSSSYFVRCFKRSYGISPGGFRQQYRQRK